MSPPEEQTWVRWIDVGEVADFVGRPLTAAMLRSAKIVVTHVNGEFGALSGVCNHAGGPLAKGRLDAEYLVCPWHNWKTQAKLNRRIAEKRGETELGRKRLV
jgi:nitrite reductase/ring-hydroxylating ferredoxin subunit